MVGLGTFSGHRMVSRIEENFGGLDAEQWRVTSPRTREYNCVAWANLRKQRATR